MSKNKILNVVANQAASCIACDLSNTRTNSVFGRGNIDSDLVLLGEAPGYWEDQEGRPFVGRSGKLLDEMADEAGLNDYYICNICKCRPPDNRKPTSDEMDACKTFLIRQLDIIRPRVIVALGATAMEGLLGPGPGVGARRGKWHRWCGIPGSGVLVRVSYHPAFILRSPSKRNDVMKDLKSVKEFLYSEGQIDAKFNKTNSKKIQLLR